MHFIFEDLYTNTRASLRFRTYKDWPVTEWDVILYGIPDDGQGKEVVVTWYTPDIDSKETFYTDSNGLEMQKRVLNERPTYDLETDEKISSNFYPINSAIAIVDEDKDLQLTVMNDRA